MAEDGLPVESPASRLRNRNDSCGNRIGSRAPPIRCLPAMLAISSMVYTSLERGLVGLVRGIGMLYIFAMKVLHGRRRRQITKKVAAARKGSFVATDALWQEAMQLRDDFEARTYGAEIVNTLQFCLVVSKDLSCLGEDLLQPRSRWHGNLYARLLALTLVEYAEDLSAILGRSFRESALALDDAPNAEERLNNLLVKLHHFRRENDEFLRRIRNNTVGHREHDARAQADWISKLEPLKILALGGELEDWTNDFLEYILPIFDKLRSSPLSSTPLAGPYNTGRKRTDTALSRGPAHNRYDS